MSSSFSTSGFAIKRCLMRLRPSDSDMANRAVSMTELITKAYRTDQPKVDSWYTSGQKTGRLVQQRDLAWSFAR